VDRRRGDGAADVGPHRLGLRRDLGGVQHRGLFRGRPGREPVTEALLVGLGRLGVQLGGQLGGRRRVQNRLDQRRELVAGRLVLDDDLVAAVAADDLLDRDPQCLQLGDRVGGERTDADDLLVGQGGDPLADGEQVLRDLRDALGTQEGDNLVREQAVAVGEGLGLHPGRAGLHRLRDQGVAGELDLAGGGGGSSGQVVHAAGVLEHRCGRGESGLPEVLQLGGQIQTGLGGDVDPAGGGEQGVVGLGGGLLVRVEGQRDVTDRLSELTLSETGGDGLAGQLEHGDVEGVALFLHRGHLVGEGGEGLFHQLRAADAIGQRLAGGEQALRELGVLRGGVDEGLAHRLDDAEQRLSGQALFVEGGGHLGAAELHLGAGGDHAL